MCCFLCTQRLCLPAHLVPPLSIPAPHCALCPARSCAACGVQAPLPPPSSPRGRSHLAKPWDPRDVSVNTCTPASHGVLGQPCEPRRDVPSAPTAQQGPGRSCLGNALLRSVLFGPSRVQVKWRRQRLCSGRGGGGAVGLHAEGSQCPQDPRAPWQMAAALPPCSEEYKCAADTVTRPRQRCWLSSRSISLPACVCGSTQLAAQAWPGADTRRGSAARCSPCL